MIPGVLACFVATGCTWLPHGRSTPGDATWLWGSPLSITAAERQNILQFCKQNTIDTIYLEVDGYLVLDSLPDGPAKAEKTAAFDAAVAEFIGSAALSGVRVQALGGDSFWANSSPLPLRLLQYVLGFNASHPAAEQFDGLQYDVEFYTAPGYSENKVEYATAFLTMVDRALTELSRHSEANARQFQLGFATPFWFDDTHVIPSIKWNQTDKPLAFHLLDTLSRRSNAYVVLMDYRNFAGGTDGSIAHAESEVAYAQAFAPETRIVVGQDTTESTPARTTFYGRRKSELVSETDLIKQHFATSPVFKGVAIHDLRGFMALWT